MLVNSDAIKLIRPFIYSDLIRVGNQADGGYVIPESVLDDATCLISFGIGYNHTFEYDIQNRVPNIRVVGFDHTVGSLYFLSKSWNGVLKLFLNRGDFMDLIKRILRFFYFLNFWTINSRNKHHKTCITPHNINKILNKYKHDNILLKIDIEGAEWDSLPIVVKDLGNVNCLIVEFHDISRNFSKFKQLLSNLKENFNLGHSHINNFSNLNYDILPDFIEMTFVNNKYSHTHKKVNKLPNSILDFKTMPNKVDFEVIF